jgi:threonine/homoserine/homoserine lactone efflux protein
MAAGSVFAFWVVALVLIVVPGADWAFTLSAGLRGRSVVPAVGGLVAGYLGITLVVTAGVGALVARSAAALTALTLVGGAYLVWHGVATFAHPPASVEAPVTDREPQHGAAANGHAQTSVDWQVFYRGIGVSGLNPKGLLVFVALLPQFTDPGRRWPVAVQIAVLGLTFTITCAAFYLCLGSFARRILHARPGAARTMSRVSGAAMVAVGLTLVIDRGLAL